MVQSFFKNVLRELLIIFPLLSFNEYTVIHIYNIYLFDVTFKTRVDTADAEHHRSANYNLFLTNWRIND